jgi:uncharacterized protein YndB with AHSA1/START domain
MIRPIRAIAVEARIDASPADVWHALTDPTAMADWFAPFVKGSTGLGGVVEFSWDGTNMWPSTIEVWHPEQHVRFANDGPPGPDGAPGPKLLVDYFISTEAGGTILRLVHSGFGPGAEWNDQIDGLTGGWTYFLWNLEICLTRHLGTRRTMVSARPRVTVHRDAYWNAIFSTGFVTMDRSTDSPATCTVTLGDRTFDAVVLMHDANARLALRIPELRDALLFIEFESTKPTDFYVGFWLSTYGLAAEDVTESQRALDAAVARLDEAGVSTAL